MNKEAEIFLEKLLNEGDSRSITTTAFAISTKNLESAPSIYSLLQINKSEKSTEFNSVIEIIESKEFPSWENWQGLKWKLWAFQEIQDIFDSPFLKGKDKLSFLKVWYFYYESNYLLHESLLAGLNGLYHASISSLRTFIEFSVLQCYFYNKSFESGSYNEIECYFNYGQNPKFTTSLKKSFSKR